MRPARANLIAAPPAGSDFRLALAASAVAHAALLATTVPFWTAVRTPAGPGVVEIPVEFVIEPKPAPVLPIPMTAAPPGAAPEIAPARRSDEALSPVVPPAPVAEAVAAADVLQPSAPEALSPSSPLLLAAPVIEALPAPETLAALAAPPAVRAVEATEVVLPQTDNLVAESALSPPPREDTALLQPASPDGGPGAAPIGPADAHGRRHCGASKRAGTEGRASRRRPDAGCSRADRGRGIARHPTGPGVCPGHVPGGRCRRDPGTIDPSRGCCRARGSASGPGSRAEHRSGGASR
jgi:hypothetical protein